MKVDTSKLRTITNFANQTGLSRVHVYRLIEAEKITKISIDGVSFILLDEKTENYRRKRAPKKKNQ